MKVKEIDIEFSHVGRKFTASGQIMKWKDFHNYPMYRIAVPRKNGYPDIYIFYKTDWEEGKPFFWYELPGMREQIARSIAKALILFSTKVEN